MTIPKDPGEYLLQDEWGLYTTGTVFPSGRMAYRQWHWTQEEAKKDVSKKHCGCTTRGMYVLPGARWEVIEKIDV